MWLGERIQERGVGNGTSLIITSGILSAAPTAFHYLHLLLDLPQKWCRAIAADRNRLRWCFFLISVILATTLISQGQRRIPVQYARRTTGTAVVGTYGRTGNIYSFEG